MNYGKIKFYDIADGTGVRTSLFVSGCTHRCPGCFNPETWSFDYGTLFDESTADKIIDSCRPSYISGLTILGGEPMEPANQPELTGFLSKFRKELPEKNVWCYTGCTFEQLTGTEKSPFHTDITAQLLPLIDVLVDGRFEEALKDITLRFRGSSNQRIIDVKKSLAERKVILWQED